MCRNMENVERCRKRGDDILSITKKIIMVIVALILVCVIGILIIASPWIMLAVGLWLSPAPPKPEITYGEFDFKLVCEIDGEIQTIEDTIICEFDGFNIDEANGKTRRWKEEFKNEQGNELYAFRVEQIDNPEFNEYFKRRKKGYISNKSTMRYETAKGHQAQLDWKENIEFVLTY